MNLFKINNNDAIEFFNVVLILKTGCKIIRATWTCKFDSKFITWEKAFCKLTYVVLLVLILMQNHMFC